MCCIMHAALHGGPNGPVGPWVCVRLVPFVSVQGAQLRKSRRRMPSKAVATLKDRLKQMEDMVPAARLLPHLRSRTS